MSAKQAKPQPSHNETIRFPAQMNRLAFKDQGPQKHVNNVTREDFGVRPKEIHSLPYWRVHQGRKKGKFNGHSVSGQFVLGGKRGVTISRADEGDRVKRMKIGPI